MGIGPDFRSAQYPRKCTSSFSGGGVSPTCRATQASESLPRAAEKSWRAFDLWMAAGLTPAVHAVEQPIRLAPEVESPLGRITGDWPADYSVSLFNGIVTRTTNPSGFQS